VGEEKVSWKGAPLWPGKKTAPHLGKRHTEEMKREGRGGEKTKREGDGGWGERERGGEREREREILTFIHSLIA
jgi:hypothetical protein